MNTILFRTWFVLLLAASGPLVLVPARADFTPAVSISANAAIEKAVLETNAQMTLAANSLDTDAFFDFIVDTDKGLIVQNGVIFRTRQAAYEAVKRGFRGVAKMDRRFENPQVTVVAADVALLVADGRYTATLHDGRTMEGRFTVSVVFILRDGRWKVLHGHYSMPGQMG